MRRREDVDAFFDVRLDPACDPPAQYRDLFDLLGELWVRVHAFRTANKGDRLLGELVAHLQNQLVSAALVLSIKVSMTDTIDEE
jgi:hypothetical protein